MIHQKNFTMLSSAIEFTYILEGQENLYFHIYVLTFLCHSHFKFSLPSRSPCAIMMKVLLTFRSNWRAGESESG